MVDVAHSPVRRRDYLTPATGMANLAEIGLLQILMIGWFSLGPVLGLPLWSYASLSVMLAALHQRQNSEWLHEGLHYNLHPRRPVNEAVAGLLAALFGTPVGPMRSAHFHHHSAKVFFMAEDSDTAYAAANSRAALLQALLKDLGGITAVQSYFQAIWKRLSSQGAVDSSQKGGLRAIVSAYWPVMAVQATLLATCIWFARLDAYFLYYFAMLSLYPVLSRLRLYGQHLELAADGSARIAGSTVSRTVEGTILDRITISSRVMQYHHEHHLYPALPFRALRAMPKSAPSDPNRYLTTHWPVLRALLREPR